MAKTIRDVAAVAGVSIATVSRVINNTNKVKPAVRLRVIKAAKKLHFYPDHSARSLGSRKTKSVGLLVPTLLNEYWASFCESTQRALLKEGYSVFLGTLDAGTEGYLETLLRSVIERKMDGLIFGAQRPNRTGAKATVRDIPFQDDYLLRRISATLRYVHLPVISFGQQIPGFSSVWGDHFQGGALVAAHLLSLGHERIAYIGGDPYYREEHDPRERGFREALTRAGITINEKLVEYVPFGIESGGAAVEKIHSRGVRFTALFCWNDLLAAGALGRLLDRGVRVPEDVSVVGFDDISIARALRPALTTVHQPIAVMGQSAADLLLDAMRTGREFVPRNVTLAMELVTRRSSDKARRGGRTTRKEVKHRVPESKRPRS
jgi:LacI family transcriptional regulator